MSLAEDVVVGRQSGRKNADRIIEGRNGSPKRKVMEGETG